MLALYCTPSSERKRRPAGQFVCCLALWLCAVPAQAAEPALLPPAEETRFFSGDSQPGQPGNPSAEEPLPGSTPADSPPLLFHTPPKAHESVAPRFTRPVQSSALQPPSAGPNNSQTMHGSRLGNPATAAHYTPPHSVALDFPGPTLPEDVKLLQNWLGKGLSENDVRLYGWFNSGYTYSSSGSGQLNIEPLENRFGQEYIINQIAVVLEKLPKNNEYSLGFRAEPYGGADASLLHPPGSVQTNDPRFGFDFRQLYISAHLPILTEGGVDLKIGRQYTIIGYESAMAPYRPMYSLAYQWFYSEDGANTGILANWHVNDQLDLLSEITQGANTFFTMRGNSPGYIGQVNYWLQPEKRTRLTGTVMVGDEVVIGAVPNPGELATVVELRVQHNWNKYFTQVIQNNMGWANNVPNTGNASWYGLYTIGMFHLTKTLDLNTRAEWFDDTQGSRTGFEASYTALTVGLNYFPQKWLQLRPEVRGDFANNPVFGPVHGTHRTRHQLTVGLECLLKF